MNKADLIEALEGPLGSRKAAADAIETLVDAIIREVAAGGSVAITGFGTFEASARAARTGRNPRTGDTVRIAATTIPKFRPGTQFKDIVADPSLLPAEGLAGARATSADAAPRATTRRAPAKRTTAASTTTPRRPAAAPAVTAPSTVDTAVEEVVAKAKKKAAKKAKAEPKPAKKAAKAPKKDAKKGK